MVQVSTEAPRADRGAQIRLGCRDELGVYGALRHRPQAPDALRLDGAEELALQRWRQRLDLVEEERAPRSGLEEAGLGAFGVREGSGLEAEQLGL